MIPKIKIKLEFYNSLISGAEGVWKRVVGWIEEHILLILISELLFRTFIDAIEKFYGKFSDMRYPK